MPEVIKNKIPTILTNIVKKVYGTDKIEKISPFETIASIVNLDDGTINLLWQDYLDETYETHSNKLVKSWSYLKQRHLLLVEFQN